MKYNLFLNLKDSKVLYGRESAYASVARRVNLIRGSNPADKYRALVEKLISSRK